LIVVKVVANIVYICDVKSLEALKMAIGLYLQTYKDRLGRRLIVVRVRDTGKDFTYSTGIKVKPIDWDSRLYRLKPSHPLYKELNKKLEEIKENSFSLHDLYKARVINFSQLRTKLEGTASGKGFDGLWSVYEKEKTESTLNSYKNAVAAFKTAINRTPTLDDIDYSNVQRAINYWNKAGKSPSTVNTYVKGLSIVKNDAFKRGLSETGFRKDRVLTQKVGTIRIETVNSKDLMIAMQKAKDDYTRDALLLWILSFISRGLYFSDLEVLNPIATGYFYHARHKTGVEMYIDSLDGLILDVFNALSHVDYKSPRIYQKRLRTELGKSFKTARKTFDTISLKLGIDMQIRFALLGHSDSTIKKHYSDMTDKDVIEKINAAHRDVLKDFGVGKSIILSGIELSASSKRFIYDNG
jgi:hypothetical protein